MRTRYIVSASPYTSPVTPPEKNVHFHLIVAANPTISQPTISKTDARVYISAHAIRGIRGYLMDELVRNGIVSWYSSR